MTTVGGADGLWRRRAGTIALHPHAGGGEPCPAATAAGRLRAVSTHAERPRKAGKSRHLAPNGGNRSARTTISEGMVAASPFPLTALQCARIVDVDGHERGQNGSRQDMIIGVDLAKRIYQVPATTVAGEAIFRKKPRALKWNKKIKNLRIPTHPVGCSDNIRSAEDRCRVGMVFDVRHGELRQHFR